MAEFAARLTDENAPLEDDIKDPMTGLPSRMLLMDRIRQAVTQNERLDHVLAVLVLNINLFHRINNTYGFAIGDLVLTKSAERLQEILRCSDTVVRLNCDSRDPIVSRVGADEFVVLLTAVRDADAVTWIVKRLMEHFSAPMSIDGTEIYLSCSAGVRLFPHDGDNAEELLRRASMARQTAKRGIGRNKLAFFSVDLNAASSRQLWLEGHMHRALANGDFTLHYQPLVHLQSGRITGMEALLRWRDPDIGMISPGDFIPVAEATGLINEIGAWVIREGCEQAREWAAAGFVDVRLALNLSPSQFRQNDLADKILSAWQDCRLAPGMLEVEVTENAVMEKFDQAIATLTRLANAGVKVALDDFGTGYSSLAYLKHLPVSTLKIDRSFLGATMPDEQDKLIMSAIIALGHSMRLDVVAEGVENEMQRAFLVGQRCDRMQGFLFSKPVPAADTIDLLRRHNAVATSNSA